MPYYRSENNRRANCVTFLALPALCESFASGMERAIQRLERRPSDFAGEVGCNACVSLWRQLGQTVFFTLWNIQGGDELVQ